MPTVALLNQAGANLGNIELSELVFGVEPNEQVVYDVVKAQLAAMRQGTQKAKTRAEVSGGGRKPWRQKGTGRARQGSIRSPQWRGGGVVFAPTPRSYEMKVNKKVVSLAMKCALSEKLTENKLTILDKIELNEIKTKSFVEIMNNIKVEDNKVLFILNEMDANVMISARNIAGVSVNTFSHVSVYDVLNAKAVVMVEAAVKSAEEVLA